MAKQDPWREPFPEQIAYFKQKINLPTSQFSDVVNAGHDKAFMVAGAQSADLLADLNSAVLKAMTDGTGLAQFRKDFNKAVLDGGWHGWAGEGSEAGYNWRTRVIYNTNMAMSYEAGRRQQMLNPELLKALPYWQYRHDDGVLHPRPEHEAWDGLTLPPTHEFWDKHFPKNGYGCQCRAASVSKSTFLKAIADGRGPANAPPAGNVSGIDPGFAHAPGAGIDMSLREAVQEKLIKYPPAISQALSADTNQYIDAHHPIADFVKQALEGKTNKAISSWRGFVPKPDRLRAAAGTDVTGYLVNFPAATIRNGAAGDLGPLPGLVEGELSLPVASDYEQAMAVLEEPDSVTAVVVPDGALPQLLATRVIGGRHYTALYEADTSPKGRTLALLALALKLT